jgi:predicted DNA-binding transcriptional regulator AlpA
MTKQPADASTNDHLLTQDAAARFLGLKNARTLSEWRVRREGPAYYKIGSLVRYRAEDIAAFIASRRVDTAASASTNPAHEAQ